MHRGYWRRLGGVALLYFVSLVGPLQAEVVSVKIDERIISALVCSHFDYSVRPLLNLAQERTRALLLAAQNAVVETVAPNVILEHQKTAQSEQSHPSDSSHQKLSLIPNFPRWWLITIPIEGALIGALFWQIKRRRAEESLIARCQYEQLLAEFYSNTLEPPSIHTTNKIQQELVRILFALGLQKEECFEFLSEKHAIGRANTVTPFLQITQNKLPWLSAKLRTGRYFGWIDALRELPLSAEAERAFIREKKARSLFVLPIAITKGEIHAIVVCPGEGIHRNSSKWELSLQSIGLFLTAAIKQRHAPQVEREPLNSLAKGGKEYFSALVETNSVQPVRGRADRTSTSSEVGRASKESEVDPQQNQKELTHLSRVASLGALSSALAHELNQPLGAILSNAQAALRYQDRQPPDHYQVREILSDIAKQAQRAGELIRHMRLLLKRGESHFVSTDINLLVAEVVRLIRVEIAQRNITVDLLLGPTLAEVPGDRVPLQQVLINLILNASDAMQQLPPAYRRIQIRTHQSKDRTVSVEVIDCGHGIKAEDMRLLFTPFFTTKTHGLGIGLAICKSIVDAHGGRLWAENNRERGATFHLELPIGAPSGAARFADESASDGWSWLRPLTPEHQPHSLQR